MAYEVTKTTRFRLQTPFPLEDSYTMGRLSMFDIVAFIERHKDEIALHTTLFGEKK